MRFKNRFSASIVEPLEVQKSEDKTEMDEKAVVDSTYL